MAVNNDELKKWCPAFKALSSPRLRIVCFHSAGSAENIFTGMARVGGKRVPNLLMQFAMENNIEVLALQLPGREKRRTEAFVSSARQVTLVKNIYI